MDNSLTEEMGDTMTIIDLNGGVNGAIVPASYGETEKAETPGRRQWTWRQWVRPLFVVLYLLFCCVIVPILIWDMHANEVYFDAYSWLTAGICALIAIGVSIYGILCHIVYFSRPNQQRYILRILLMVPIYSINSSIALRVPQAAIFLDSIRACYQAFVVYCFLFYLLHYLYEHYDLVEHLAAKPQMKSPKPFCCFRAGPNKRLVFRSRNGVLNFVIIGPLTTILSIFFYYLSDMYEEGTFSVRGAWFWLNIISAVSQVWAMYCLAIFYQATKEETRPLRPLPQMLCVKWAVFGSFFQQFIIALLIDLGAIKSPPEWEFTPNEFSSEIHNLLVCIEMAIVSVIHLFAFTHVPYKSGEPLAFRASCRGICDYSDMTTNMRMHSGRIFGCIKRRAKGEDAESIVKEGDMIMDYRDPESVPTNTSNQASAPFINNAGDGGALSSNGSSLTNSVFDIMRESNAEDINSNDPLTAVNVEKPYANSTSDEGMTQSTDICDGRGDTSICRNNSWSVESPHCTAQTAGHGHLTPATEPASKSTDGDSGPWLFGMKASGDLNNAMSAFDEVIISPIHGEGTTDPPPASVDVYKGLTNGSTTDC